jgi:hypothetical protein
MRGYSRGLCGAALCLPALALAQIDPVKRDLFQFGYNQPLEGREPVAGYAFYYHNDPGFLKTNDTLRVALAPTYVDSELGIAHALGPETDLAVGLAGGGFADSYNEFQDGRWLQGESFDGHDGEVNASVYHRFNPQQQIPLSLVVHGAARYSLFEPNDNTAASFKVPDDGMDLTLRTGLRYGGIEPTLFPELAMELSVWYEGQLRTDSGSYGFNGDRQLREVTHSFWGSAALSYTFQKTKQNFFVRATAGTTINPDRLSAYRLGGFLPLIAEYPLSLPGYFYQEFSARDFALINTSYIIPIAPNERWSLMIHGATAVVDYLSGTGQSGNWISGVGGGILYRSPSDKFKCIVCYDYGVDAIRHGDRGANAVSFLIQVDIGRIQKGSNWRSAQPNEWRGWNWLLGR